MGTAGPIHVAVLALLVATGGCSAKQQLPRTARCVLSPGMTVDQLALCGCVSADTRSDYRVPLQRPDDVGAVTRVAIVNYMCPLGSAGIARVVVKNGQAIQVDY